MRLGGAGGRLEWDVFSARRKMDERTHGVELL